MTVAAHAVAANFSSFRRLLLGTIPLLAVPPPKLVVTPPRRLYTRQYNHQTRLNSNVGWNGPATEMKSLREAYTTRSISRRTRHQTRPSHRRSPQGEACTGRTRPYSNLSWNKPGTDSSADRNVADINE